MTISRPGQRELRKRILADDQSGGSPTEGEIDLVRDATIGYSSEDPSHPLEHVIDGRAGPAGTRWISGRSDTTEQIIIEFDRPQTISRMIYEVEERERERTQEVRVAASSDCGATYRQILVQEYTFSPRGATFELEDLRLSLDGVTHLRLDIVPNKQGSGVATLTSLRLFH